MTVFFFPCHQRNNKNQFFFLFYYSRNTGRLAIVLEQYYVDYPDFRISKFVSSKKWDVV